MLAHPLIWINAAPGAADEPCRTLRQEPTMSIRVPSRSLLVVALCTVVPQAFAQAVGWEFESQLRLRQEHVEDEAFRPSADATTLRLRAGLHGRFGGGWEALVEGEGIASAGAFNDGRNGHAGWPVVADPRGAELNQAWLRHAGPRVTATAGRQRLLMANQRWIGNSGWRQNEQTFDAVALDARLHASTTLHYAWLGRVHRVNGDQARDPLARERRLDSHYAELAWTHGALQVAPYVLLHRDRDLATASTGTRGLRGAWNGVRDGHGCRIEADIARQTEAGDAPLAFSHDYWRIEPACVVRGTTLRAGVEHLGGDGTHALQAPLGTLHAFNGWADKFNAIPAGGLEDRYLGAGGKLGRGRALDWQVAWHDYRADTGGDYGREWNASLGGALGTQVKWLAKVADYRADGYARDTRKLWLQLEWTR